MDLKISGVIKREMVNRGAVLGGSTSLIISGAKCIAKGWGLVTFISYAGPGIVQSRVIVSDTISGSGFNKIIW